MSAPPEWTLPIARFQRAGGLHVGGGVLVAGDVVLTCAHVVEDALPGSQEKTQPATKLSIDFPFAGLYKVQATIAVWWPAIPEGERHRDSAPSDLAVLTLDNPESVRTIDPGLIAETDPRQNTPVSCEGFPAGYPNGALAEAVLRGQDAGGWIDAIADAEFGHFIEPGFSGSPVFAGRQETVRACEILGVCVTADIGGKRVARLIPPAQLAEAVRSVVSPYRWLEHFGERHVGYFFGREKLTAELGTELQRQRFLLLAGPPGSGKSSLLRAGLMANARRQRDTLAIRPLTEVKAELARALNLPTGVPPDDEGIRRALEVRLQAGGLLLGIDQAEELVYGANLNQAPQFLQFLAELRADFDGLQIALAARSDALPALLAAQPRSRLLEKNLRYIDELGREELRAAIERPAKRLRVTFAPGMVPRLVNDALQEPRVPMPILQLCLSRLWESREGSSITEQAYEGMGGLTGALANQANRVLGDAQANIEKMPKFMRSIMEAALGVKPLWPFSLLPHVRLESKRRPTLSEGVDRIFGYLLLQLVEVGDRGEDLRRRVPLSSFGWSTSVIRSLAEGRLVLISHDSASGEEVAELAHDSLLTKWDKLKDWIEARRDHLRLRSQLQREAAYWNARGRPAAYRWSDERALEAGAMIRSLSYRPSEVEAAFLGPVDQNTMLRKLKDTSTTHAERATIGDRLAFLGDTRPGTSVNDGLPDLVWCPVPEGVIRLAEGAGEFRFDSFSIAKYPVTYAQYRVFIEATDGYRDLRWWADLAKRYYEEPGRQIPRLDNHPAVNVDWMEAVAYSRWLSYRLRTTIRLPAEWEWQQAATRGKPGFEFPWGSGWDRSRANTYENGLNRTVAVGLYLQDAVDGEPLDLAGNVWEWCLNEYRKPVPVADIIFSGLETRAIRGGAGSSPGKYARASFRNHYRPDYRFDALGFRLVRVDPVR